MKTFILAMVLHPDVYQKAQAEVDRVVGPGRLPDFEDRENLPYLECVLKEVFRYVVRSSCHSGRACAHNSRPHLHRSPATFLWQVECPRPPR